MILLWLLLSLLGVTSSQLHPSDATSAVTCHECGGRAGSYPGCLSQPPKTCHPDEVCMLRYGGAHETTSHCHRAEQCQHEVGGAAVHCSTGGAEVRGQCQICCSDATCLTHSLSLLNVNPTLDVMALHCPTSCPADQAATCVITAHLCHDNQFCLVTRDANHVMAGACTEKRELTKCHHDVAGAVCDPHRHHCAVACCEDGACVAGVFTSTVVASQTPPTTLHGAGVTQTVTVTHTTAPLSTHPETHPPVTTPPLTNPPVTTSLVTTHHVTTPPVTTHHVTTPSVTTHHVTTPPETNPPVTEPPETDLPVVDPTGAPVTDAPGGGEACVDSIQHMSCADVTDVCESLLLSSYCQKFCGLCTA